MKKDKAQVYEHNFCKKCHCNFYDVVTDSEKIKWLCSDDEGKRRSGRLPNKLFVCKNCRRSYSQKRFNELDMMQEPPYENSEPCEPWTW